VCDYLVSRGDAYREVTSAARWISLSDSLDRHSVDATALSVPTTVVGFTSDQLVPIEDSRALAQRLARLEQLVEAPSLFGHDAFLKERGFVSDALRSALSPLTAALKDIAA
jgi:Homoserine acetyltransferase